MLKLFCKKVFRNQSSLFHPHELYLGKRYEASGKGVSNPNFKKICKGFGVRYSEIKKNKDIERVVKKALSSSKPEFVNVLIDTS